MCVSCEQVVARRILQSVGLAGVAEAHFAAVEKALDCDGSIDGVKE
jgi:hypothetical protein